MKKLFQSDELCITIVLNGDKSVLKTVLSSVESGIPVLLIRESRGAADLLANLIDKFKVFTPYAAGSSNNLGNFGNKIIGYPNEVCSNTYMTFLTNSENESKSLISYMNTKFCNFFLSLRKNTQNMKPDTFKWIPLVELDRQWTDELLFDYFNLTDEEKKLILEK
jgi:hypothetical protein